MNTSISPNHCIVVPPNLTGKILKVVTKDYNNMNTTSAYISSLTLIDSLAALSNDLSNYLDKRIGGEVSGNIDIYNANLSVLSGNYTQTDKSSISNYFPKNAFVHADGNITLGTKGFCITKVINDSELQLSGDITQLKELMLLKAPTASDTIKKNILQNTDDLSNALFSIQLSAYSSSMRFQISDINEYDSRIRIKGSLSADGDFNIAKLSEMTTEQLIDAFYNDDNAFYLVGFPEVGNLSIANFFGQHAEGNSINAIGKYTHVEGQKTIADSRYAHAEGAQSFAGDFAAHAEGKQTCAKGKQAHAEGWMTAATATTAHAEGKNSTASGKYSHAEGNATYAIGTAAHAEGNAVSAIGNMSHAEGENTIAWNKCSRATGKSTAAGGATLKGYAFRVAHITPAENKIALATSLNGGTPSDFKYAIGDVVSFIDDHEYSNYATIQNVIIYAKSAAIVLDRLPFTTPVNTTAYVYCANKATLGPIDLGINCANANGYNTLATGIAATTNGYNTTAYGNYSFAGGNKSITIGNNSFAYGNDVSAISENSYATGISSIAGCYGWYYDHIDYANNAFYLTSVQPKVTHTSSLTGAGTIDETFDSGFDVGDIISYVNKAKFDMKLVVSEVSGNKITVESFTNTNQYKLDESTPNHDDWSIFCPDKPAIGQIQFGEVAYAAGLDCKAINAYSHAEGKQNLAYGQYSHIEGYKNRGAYAAHAEGKGNYADGQYSHAEGWNNRALADCSHAEGYATSALNEYAHTTGYKTLASGQYSYASGSQTSAIANNTTAIGNKSYADGYCAFACGDSVSALNTEAFAIGYGSKAISENTFAGGNQTFASNYCAFAYGDQVSALSTDAFAIGFKNTASGQQTFTGGQNSTAEGSQSFAFGNKTYAKSYCSFATGDQTSALNAEAFAIGFKNTASGQYSFAGGQNSTAGKTQAFAFGNNVSANGGSSFASGFKTVADKDNTYCLGLNAKAKDLQSFVWSGIYNTSDVKYESNGESTFNINPKNNISGVYIGTDNFIACVLKAVQGMSNDQKAALKTALGL